MLRLGGTVSHISSPDSGGRGADQALSTAPAERVSKDAACVCTWLSAVLISLNRQRQKRVGASCPGPPGRSPPHCTAEAPGEGAGGTGGATRLPLAPIGMLGGRSVHGPTQAQHTLRVRE